MTAAATAIRVKTLAKTLPAEWASRFRRAFAYSARMILRHF